MPLEEHEAKLAESREHLKLTPDCESEYVKLADDEATGFAGSETMLGAGVVTVQV